MAPQPVDAPESEPGSHGLFAVAEEVSLGVGDYWQNGIAFLPESCNIPVPIPLNCSPEDSENALNADADGSAITWYPFLAIGRDSCTYLFPQGEDREARLRRNLEATESHQAESELMFLTATVGTDTENPGLFSSAGYDDVGTSNLVSMVSLVDARTYEGLAGQEGMLHVSPRVASVALAYDLFRYDENDTDKVLHSNLGNRVVIGSGYVSGMAAYNSTGGDQTPALEDGDDLIFGTPMVYFTRGDITFQGFDNSQSSFRENIRNVWAERPILLWSTRCVVVGGKVDWTMSADGSTSGIDGGGA